VGVTRRCEISEGQRGFARLRALARTGATVALLATALLVLTAGVAQAHVVFAHGRAYGVMLPSRTGAKPLSSLSGRAAPLTVGGPQSPVVYGGGPLMLTSKLYLIFWEQKAGEFASEYTEPIIQYAKDLQAEDTHTTDEFSVAEQYTDKAGKSITGNVEFGDDVFVTGTYPPLEEAEGCTKAEAPCVTDRQIRKEIVEQIEANHWPTDPAGAPEAQYLLYTPKGVATCEFGECAPEAFCAYHSEITEIGPEKKVAVYSDLPYVSECDSGQAPSGVGGNKDADGTLDSEIHEIVESATDPDPPRGYTDEHGEEVADKCTGPIVELQPEVYGTPLGGSLTADTAFNQLINGHSYYTQQIWSNAPTVTPKPVSVGEPAGCAARIGPTPSFATPASGETGRAIDFDGSGSYDIGAPIAKYEWSFGDGSPPDTTSGADPTHYYVQPGTYQVSLTVSDGEGSADASTQTLPITVTGAAVGTPNAAIVSPAENQTYTAGESVATSFSCADAAGGPGIASCTDSDASASPGRLDTATVGAHSYTVTAVSLDGERGTATIEYTVASPGAGSGGNSSGGGGGSPSNSTSSSGSGAGTSPGASASSSTTSGGSGAGTTSTTSGAKPKATPTSARKLAQAIKACRKLKKSKRTRCVATAKRRFAPAKKGRHKKADALDTLGDAVSDLMAELRTTLLDIATSLF
jgi:PKD repeat protein